MEKLLTLLSNRRAWSFIVASLTSLLLVFKIDLGVDQDSLTESLTAIGTAVGALVSGGLALWSLLKPKENNQQK